MPFIRRKRGQVLIVHNRRTTSGKVRQEALASFASPVELEATLDGPTWESWCRDLAWRHPRLSWKWAEIEEKLRAALEEWMSSPSGQSVRSEQHIQRLCKELTSSLTALSPALPADRHLLVHVRPSLAELGRVIDSALDEPRDLAAPQHRSRETMDIDKSLRSSDAGQLFDQGMEHWWAGDRPTACRLYRRALKIDLLHADANNHLGIVALERRQLKAAAGHFQAAIDGGSRSLVRDRGLVEWGHLENRPYLRALHNLALVHAERGDHEESAALWEQILTFNPNDNQGVRWLLGEAYHRLRRLDDAIVAYERALDEPGCCYNLALALHEQGDRDRVGTALVRAFARNRYVAPMLLGERWEEGPRHSNTNMADPEWAADYVKRCADMWRRVEDSAELLRKWWQSEPVRAWLLRRDELASKLDGLAPGDMRSLLVHQQFSLVAEATLRKVASDVDPEPFSSGPRRHPYVANLAEVHVSRHGESAVFEYQDPDVYTLQLHIGPEIERLSDQELLDIHNERLEAIQARREADPFVAVEVPPGQPQIEFDESMAHWGLRGHVLRGVISDKDLELHLDVDGRLLGLKDLEKMLLTYAGWGLRIVVMPDDEIERPPNIVVREPDA